MPNKSIFRWTVGPCLDQGLSILRHSIDNALQAFGEQTFRWVVCHNNIDATRLDFCKKLSPDIEIIPQDWKDFPLVDLPRTCYENGTFRNDTWYCGGTTWKICPPRLDTNVHEIICDNDLMIITPPPKLLEFLASDKPFLTTDTIRFFGRWDHCFSDPKMAYNSGLIGLPPGFDFRSKIRKSWEENGRPQNLSYADEQGLVTHCLTHEGNAIISDQEIIALHAGGQIYFERGERKWRPYAFLGDEYGFHFIEANRAPHHEWPRYLESRIKFI